MGWNTTLQAALFPPNQTFPLSPGEPKQARKQTDGAYLCMIIDQWHHKRQVLSNALSSTGRLPELSDYRILQC